MNTNKLHNWLTLTANLAVVASIIFLAVEIRQNSELLEAEIRTIRHGFRAADYLLPMEHEQFGIALLKMHNGESLTEYETLILHRSMAVTLFNYQYVFTEYKLGRISESDLPIRVWRLDLDGENDYRPGWWPDLREYWEATKHTNFDPEFVEWMDENIVNYER
ncbi:MAG: hypothetical protein R3192_09085 [Woeseiaceae bacterium]|nr:hypothetical protein [Woeseiaceae bacterium]